MSSFNIGANVSRPAAVGDFVWFICPAKIKINAKKSADVTEPAPIEADRCYLLPDFPSECVCLVKFAVGLSKMIYKY